EAVSVVSRERPVQRRPPLPHLRRLRSVLRRLVGDVVAVAHECVDGAHRGLPVRRQRHERVVEVLRLRSGDLLAAAVRLGQSLRRQRWGRIQLTPPEPCSSTGGSSSPTRTFASGRVLVATSSPSPYSTMIAYPSSPGAWWTIRRRFTRSGTQYSTMPL